MHKKYLSSLYLTIFFTLAAVAVQAQALLPWSAQRLLIWEDFKGKPDAPELVWAAATFAGLSLEIADVNMAGRVSFKVQAVFDRQRSWAHPDRRDAAVLAHEQLHFDIAEMYARRLERKLNAMKLKVKDKTVAKKLVAQYNQAQMKEQERFDKECVHGLNQEHEGSWRTKVDRELGLKRAGNSLAQAK